MEWIKNLSCFIKIKDVISFFKFRKQIKKLKKSSVTFNELGLNHNWLGNIVYLQLNCTDEEIAKYNYSPIDAVMNKIKPHIDYLTELGWGEYLIPEITNFIDDDGNNTLSYLVLFVYAPIKFSLLRFIYKIIIIFGLLIGGYFAYYFFN